MNKSSKVNRVALTILSCVLVIAGTSGFLLPVTNMTSTAASYNTFHIIFGLIGFALLVWGCEKYIKIFNIGFGTIDLYQFIAGQMDLFPKIFFSLKPADDWLHLLFGATLVIIGYWGIQKTPTQSLS